MNKSADEGWSDSLRQVMLQTLEDFAFLFGEAESVEGEFAAETISESMIVGGVAFRVSDSEASGTVQVLMAQALCVAMAADILGVEADDLPANAAVDAVKEWANIVTGAVTALRFGTDSSVTLDPPFSELRDPAAAMAFIRDDDTVRIEVDGFRVAGRVCVV